MLKKTWKEWIALILCFWCIDFLVHNYLNPDIIGIETFKIFFIILLIVLGIGYSIGVKTYWD